MDRITSPTSTLTANTLPWEVNPRVLFIYDPKLKSLPVVRTFLQHGSYVVNIAENHENALSYVRTEPFKFDLIVLCAEEIDPSKPSADQDFTNVYFIGEISKKPELRAVPAIVISDELFQNKPNTSHPNMLVCPSTISTEELFTNATRMLEAAKQQAPGKAIS